MRLSQEVAGDNLPVARLYETHAAALFAYLRRQTGSREDAEDALVEVFVAAVETRVLEHLNEKEQIAWLWRVARNKGVDAYRRSRQRQGLDLDLLADQIVDDEKRAPEQMALQREEYARLHAYLEKLSPTQREAVRLRFANELRCSEIATVLGKREGAVRVLLSRALNFLRSIYEKEQEETLL
jgi:RNA polymerase sigma-70 factor (ECF subfamily)